MTIEMEICSIVHFMNIEWDFKFLNIDKEILIKTTLEKLGKGIFL